MISSGSYGWPATDAAHQAVTAVRNADTCVQEVTFVAFSEEMAGLLRRELTRARQSPQRRNRSRKR